MKTRQAILLLVFVLISLVNVKGQVTFGARTGLQFTNISATGINLGATGFLETGARTGFTAGIFGEVQVARNLFFTPELNYSEKGFRMAQGFGVDIFGTSVPVGAEINTKFRYIELPLLIKYQVGFGPVDAYVTAGPSFGYAMNGVVNTRINAILDFQVARIPLSLRDNLYHRFEAGGQVGAGVSLDLPGGKFLIDARYHHGFTDVIRDPVVDLGIRNRGFSLGIGYAINF